MCVTWEIQKFNILISLISKGMTSTDYIFHVSNKLIMPNILMNNMFMERNY